MTSEEFVTKKGYKLVPPDGGYGYVILVAASVNFVSLTPTMFGVCFGMIFNDLFTKLKMGATEISLLTGLSALAVSVSAFLAGPLLKVMSRRKLALLGAVLLNAGVFGAIFVNSMAQLIACQGLLQFFGYGFLYNVSCTILNEYFLEKRLFAMSIAQTLSAAAAMVAPMIVSWSMAEYGFRGTLIVISAINLQTIVASALLQPVARHMKKEVLEDVHGGFLCILMEMSINDLKNKVLETPVIKSNDIEDADDLFNEKKQGVKLSIANIVITWIKEFIDWPLFKKFALTCGCLGGPVSFFVDSNFVFFLAQYLYDLKWDNDQVKWALALIGFGDIAGRILLIFSSSWLKRLGSHVIYVAGLFIAIVTKLGMLWITDYTWTLAIVAVMGLSRCTIGVLYPMVVADSVEPDQFPSAMGISMMMFGILAIIMGPAVGAIRDATGNYTIMFLIMIGLLIVTVVAWIIELLRGKRKMSSIEGR
ncbi:monocarboxylate transporter 6-like [Cydia fagiglandana]|uniref:monocarboxylate transporter 6-like n=1 Tax=Cydia fagiglandana TaxID=1458189 RepID=UPI002FEE6239